MPDDKLSRLESLLKIANEGYATTKEVAAVAIQIISSVRDVIGEMFSRVDEVQKAVDTGDKALNSRVDDVEVSIVRERKEIDAAIRDISLTPGEPGKDADPDLVKRMVLSEIEIPDELEPITPKEVRDMLESLIGKERLDAKAIKGIEELVQSLASKDGDRPVWVGGRAGIQTTVNGKKIGLVQYIDYEAGTNVTIVPVFKNGVLTLTVNSTGGGSAGTWYLGEQVTLGGDSESFTLAHAPTAIVELLLDRQPQIYGVDFTGTINGTNKNFAFTSPVDSSLLTLVYANYL